VYSNCPSTGNATHVYNLNASEVTGLAKWPEVLEGLEEEEPFELHATDNYDNLVYPQLTSFKAGYLPGSDFPVGVTTLTYTTTDTSKNVAICQFKINVTDVTPPVIFCPERLVDQSGFVVYVYSPADDSDLIAAKGGTVHRDEAVGAIAVNYSNTVALKKKKMSQ
jgi:hypothetical protein